MALYILCVSLFILLLYPNRLFRNRSTGEEKNMSDKDIKTLITSGTLIFAVILYLIFK